MAQETSNGVPISDGFDFPVGPRGADDVFKTHKVDTVLVDPAYYKARNFWHTGEDWNGRRGGDTDLGDPIYAISNGKVADFGHYPVWGNIVLVEHALPDGSRVWSQYAHLDKIMVRQKGQKVERGQQIGTMGKGDKNRYIAHLHFEIRKNKLPIDNWSPMANDRNAVLANYYSPTQFIKSHRPQKLGKELAALQPVQIVIDPQLTTPQAGVGVFARANVSNWFRAAEGYQGNTLWTHVAVQNETHWAEWRPSLPSAGRWHVWAFIPPKQATTTYARYKIVHTQGQTEIPVNQGGNRNQWVNLGTYNLAPGQGYVRLGNVTGELTQGTPHIIGFDAICWTKAD